LQAIDNRPLPQSAGFFSAQMSGAELAMPSFQQPAGGMLMDAQPQAQQRQQQQQQQQQLQHSSHDQRMRSVSGAGGSGDTSDSDSCRSGDSDGDEDGPAGPRGTAMQTEQNGRHDNGGRHDTSPTRPGLWASSQQFAVKQEAGADRSVGRSSSNNNRTKKPHLKVDTRAFKGLHAGDSIQLHIIPLLTCQWMKLC
jgi:hypothetical protein